MVVGSYADGWWHLTFGRDYFWTTPHIVLYSGFMLAITGVAIGLISEKRSRIRASSPHLSRSGYKISALGIVLVLAAALSDELWHRIVGSDTLYSPPHLLGVLGTSVIILGMIKGLSTTFNLRSRPGLVLEATLFSSAFLSILAIQVTPLRFLKQDAGHFIEAGFLAMVVPLLLLASFTLINRPGAVTVIQGVRFLLSDAGLSSYYLVVWLAIISDILLWKRRAFEGTWRTAFAGPVFVAMFYTIYSPTSITETLLSYGAAPLAAVSLSVGALSSLVGYYAARISSH